MPYRIDIADPPSEALDVLVDLGALDVEPVGDGIAAILPDAVTQDTVCAALGLSSLSVSAAMPRDEGSVWLLSSRSVRIGSLLFTAADAEGSLGALKLIDSKAFGTGHHATSALCVEALEEILGAGRVESMLDVGTGSGILAIAALALGVETAVGIDIDADALRTAAENARLNACADRLRLVLGGPESVDGSWPLVVANVLAAPLIEMAPTVVRRVASRGSLIVSGIHWTLEREVAQAYRHFGMRHIGSKTRGGWTALVLQASW